MSSFKSFLVLALLLVSCPSRAFDLQTAESGQSLRWPSGEVRLRIDAMMDFEQMMAFRASVDTWNEALTDVSIVIVEGETTGEIGDKVSDVHWVMSGWPYPDEWPAVTILNYHDDEGDITEGDILIRGDIEWCDAAKSGSCRDLQNVLTHELGHFIGLAHSMVEESTMYPSYEVGETNKRDLEEDDWDAVQSLYSEPWTPEDLALDGPLPEDQEDFPLMEDASPSLPGCSMSGSQNPSLLGLLLLALALPLILRRSSR